MPVSGEEEHVVSRMKDNRHEKIGPCPGRWKRQDQQQGQNKGPRPGGDRRENDERISLPLDESVPARMKQGGEKNESDDVSIHRRGSKGSRIVRPAWLGLDGDGIGCRSDGRQQDEGRNALSPAPFVPKRKTAGKGSSCIGNGVFVAGEGCKTSSPCTTAPRRPRGYVPSRRRPDRFFMAPSRGCPSPGRLGQATLLQGGTPSDRRKRVRRP